MVRHWIEQLPQTQFHLVSQVPEYHTQELGRYIELANQALARVGMSLGPHDLDWLDQSNLNKVHEVWVKSQHKQNLIEYLRRVESADLVRKFRKINDLVHHSERPVEYLYDIETDDAWQTPNIFGTDILDHGTWQVELEYQNLGRSNYEKWRNWDNNAHDTDTNNFTHIGAQVLFRVCKPYQRSAPVQYVQWCNQFDISPTGSILPIGNFQEDISTVRKRFESNAGRPGNDIVLSY
jgi:hypothetical protein